MKFVRTRGSLEKFKNPDVGLGVQHKWGFRHARSSSCAAEDLQEVLVSEL